MIPTKDGTAFTLTTGWVWSVSTPISDRQLVAEDLAIFLSEAAFTGSWTQAAGYLPVRPSGLASWEAGPDQSLASIILPAAVSMPSYSTLAIVGPAFQQAATVVIKQELSVSQAAAAVIIQLENEEN